MSNTLIEKLAGKFIKVFNIKKRNYKNFVSSRNESI